MPTQLGNITFDTTLLNKVEVSGIIVDTINTVENIVAEAVSTAWKAGGSQPASAFSSNTLLTEANEGKVYNLSDALTITEANRQYFTENDTGTYPAGTNVAVIETTPATYRAATGTAVSGTVYYAKNGNYYTEVTVQEGDPVTGLYVRTSQPVYKYDVLAGSDASSVKKVKVGAHAYSGSTVAICGAASNKDGYMHSGDFHKLSGIAAKANVGFNTVTNGSSSVTAASGKINLLFSGAAPVTVGVYDATSGAKVALGVSDATASSPGVMKLYGSADGTASDGSVTQNVVHALSGAIHDIDNFSTVKWKKAAAGSTTTFTSGDVSPSSNNNGLTIKTESPVTISGTMMSCGDMRLTIGARAATGTYAGVTKLYANANGTNKDGTVTQSGIKAIADSVTALRNYSRITTKYQTWRSGETPTTEWHSGSVAPATNSSAVTIYGEGSVQVSNPYGSIAISVARPDNEHDWPGVVTVLDTVGDTTEASCGVTASPKMVTDSSALRVKKSITLSGLRQVSNDTQTPIPASINPTDMPNTLYGLIKALKFAANHAS